VNGLRMAISRPSKLFGTGKNRLAIAYELEIRGDGDVGYDISRAKLTGRGRGVLVQELHSAVKKGLEELGYYGQLAAETRVLLDLSRPGPVVSPGEFFAHFSSV